MATLEQLPGLDKLGKGYDVFGDQMATSSVKRLLFNLGESHDPWKPNKNHEYGKPFSVTALTQRTGKSIHRYGSSIDEYATSLNVNAKLSGSYTFFKGSLSADFTSSQRESIQTSYSMFVDRSVKWVLRLDQKKQTLIGMLTDDARNDIDSMDSLQLFDRYGTHALLGVVVGAIAQRKSTVNSRKYESKIGIKAAAELEYKDTVGTTAKGKIGVEYTKAVDSYRSNGEQVTTCIGGNPAYVHSLNKENYQQWMDSIDDYPEWIDFEPNGDHQTKNLLGIWDLCADAARRKTVHDAYIRYAAVQGKISSAKSFEYHDFMFIRSTYPNAKGKLMFRSAPHFTMRNTQTPYWSIAKVGDESSTSVMHLGDAVYIKTDQGNLMTDIGWTSNSWAAARPTNTRKGPNEEFVIEDAQKRRSKDALKPGQSVVIRSTRTVRITGESKDRYLYLGFDDNRDLRFLPWDNPSTKAWHID